MKMIAKVVVGAAMVVSSTLAVSTLADAQITIGVGIGGGGGGSRVYLGYYPPGPCDSYDYYYEGDCGYAVYNGPIIFNNTTVRGPHYYRWYNGVPYFWYRGGWHYWGGWNHVRWNWNRSQGWGWRNGRWNRAWGGEVRTMHHGGYRGGDVYRGGRPGEVRTMPVPDNRVRGGEVRAMPMPDNRVRGGEVRVMPMPNNRPRGGEVHAMPVPRGGEVRTMGGEHRGGDRGRGGDRRYDGDGQRNR